VALASVLTGAGRPSEAADLMTRASELYDRKGNLVAAARLAGDVAQPGATA
jgi:hypothetical protein